MDHQSHGISHTFPALTTNMIKMCMSELDIPMTDEEITKPTMAKMLQVYDSISILLQGVGAEQFSQPTFAVLDLLEHPELHKESLGLVGFYRHL